MQLPRRECLKESIKRDCNGVECSPITLITIAAKNKENIVYTIKK